MTVRQGGPQVNHSQLLAAGAIDFIMGGNLFSQFNFLWLKQVYGLREDQVRPYMFNPAPILANENFV